MAVRWCVATCQPYPDQVLAPVAHLLRGLAGIRPSDGPAAVHDRLVAALTPLFPPTRVATAVPALQRMLTTPDGSAAALAGAAICREVLLRLAAHRPLIVAVDDLDRAAPAVSRFLHALFSAATERGLPLALLTVHQPQWADTRPGPARRVTIGPLATVQSGRLLRHLLTRAGQPVALVDRLLPLVGGRPGHAAAYVTSVVDGADPAALPLPEAVRRAVGAELDHLDGERRAVLMAAGTLGGLISGRGRGPGTRLDARPVRTRAPRAGRRRAAAPPPRRRVRVRRARAAPGRRRAVAPRPAGRLPAPGRQRAAPRQRAPGRQPAADAGAAARALNGSAARSAEIVRLDTVGARAGRLDAVFAALAPVGPGGATGPTALETTQPRPDDGRPSRRVGSRHQTVRRAHAGSEPSPRRTT